ncbi:MAG: allophanate hydrolase subunit 2 [Pseudonocardiales bacterium]|nr:allophanate hydrolase subunit 2 [Pseudonocardiales bacterium]
MKSGLVVLATGPLASVQDLGRPGLARLGVSPSGAADRGALALGNRLVGNPEGAAGIEVTLGGLSVRARRPLLIALTGADAHAEIDGHPIGTHASVTLSRKAVLTLRTPASGLRTYLSVRGGIRVEPVLGSRSYDTLAGLGPPALQVGDRIKVGVSDLPVPEIDWATEPASSELVSLDCLDGPRADWFSPSARRTFYKSIWTVTGDLDRVGVRLAGPALERTISTELPSEGLVRGAVQVPANGQPLIFLADHPTTGGYPVIAVVSNTDAVAQLRPGQSLRFTHR